MRERSDGYYRGLWDSMVVLADWEKRLGKAVERICARAGWYEGLEADWQLVAVIHELECGGNPERQILNGERWDCKTRLVPAGLGPWVSWREAAEEALRGRRLESLGDVEAWNGWGYAIRGMHSPYLWSGSNHGVGVGKFVADGVYGASAVSKQIGAAVLLHGLGWEPREMGGMGGMGGMGPMGRHE